MTASASGRGQRGPSSAPPLFGIISKYICTSPLYACLAVFHAMTFLLCERLNRRCGAGAKDHR